jgi:hypothetical protein
MAVSRVAFWVAITVATVGTSSAQTESAHAEPRAVIELFTSQGCSACPAADRLLGDLSRDPSIITMSLPINYWDYIGWPDTLALPENTKRQWAYARALGERGVSTPQAVINGGIQVLGSDRAAIEQAIELSHKSSSGPTLPVAISVDQGEIKVVAARVEATHSGEVWLCSMAKAIPVIINRGENRGRTITYHNVVRHWRKLGDWTGAADTWTIPVKDVESDGVDEVAVVVQAGTSANPGSVLGAAIADLHGADLHGAELH